MSRDWLYGSMEFRDDCFIYCLGGERPKLHNNFYFPPTRIFQSGGRWGTTSLGISLMRPYSDDSLWELVCDETTQYLKFYGQLSEIYID